MLSKKQIKYLRGLANTLTAKYQIGKNEITDSTIELLDNALTAHELIKVSLNKSVKYLDFCCSVFSANILGKPPYIK